MRAFVGKCPDGYEVDHENWNIVDNRLENLSYQPKELNRGRHSPEWQKNQSEAMKKLTQDPEWQRKNSEAVKKRSQDPEYLRKNAEAVRKALCKRVKQYSLDGEYIKTWTSIVEAARELGIDNSAIGKCCKGKYKSAGGYLWRMEQ